MATIPSQTEFPEWTLGDRLTKARKIVSLSRAEMAAELGVSDQSIRDWEEDERPPKAMVIKAWAIVTGVSVAWLEGREEPPGSPPHGGGGGPGRPVGPPTPPQHHKSGPPVLVT